MAPITRRSIVMGQALGGTTLALGARAIFLVLAPMAGIHLNLRRDCMATVMMAPDRFRADQHRTDYRLADRIHSGLPRDHEPDPASDLAALGRVLSAAGAPGWLGWTMRLNPLTYGMAALRKGLYLGEPVSFCSLAEFRWSVLISIAFALAMFAAATRVANRSTSV